MNTYIISDTHFNHLESMMKWCGRPENYEEILAYELLALPGGDMLIHLGDICIGGDQAIHDLIIKPMRCKKVLVRGNHDNKSDNWYLNNGWDFVCSRFDTKMFGRKIAFTHVPIAWDGYHDLNIHGHFHNSDHRRNEPELQKIKNGYQKLYAPEYFDYKPVLLKIFIN